jgi:hypothetical protein
LYISYSQQDQVFANQLADSITLKGGEVLPSAETFRAGENWAATLRESIQAADALILVMPRHRAPASNWVFAEAGAAKAFGKDIVIVVPDLDAVDRGNIPLDLASTLIMDASKQSIDKVASTVLGAVARN